MAGQTALFGAVLSTIYAIAGTGFDLKNRPLLNKPDSSGNTFCCNALKTSMTVTQKD
jgi:hypothetical protein